MTGRSRSHPACVLLAVVLGIANAVLCTLWLRDGGAPPTPSSHELRTTAAAPAAGAPTNEGAANPVAATARADEASSAPPESRPATTALLYGSMTLADGGKPRAASALLKRGEQSSSTSVRDGSYAFAGLEPGPYSLSTQCEDELPLRLDVDVKAPRTRVDIVLPKAWTLRVDAVTPDGAPLVDVVKEQHPDLGWFRSLSALAFEAPLVNPLPLTLDNTIDAGIGSFRGADQWRNEKAMPKQAVGLLTLPPDEPVHVALLLRSTVIGWMPARPTQGEITFVLTPDALLASTASVRLRLVDTNGAPLAGVKISLTDSNSSGGGIPSNEEGRVSWSKLQPGRFDLDVSDRTLLAPPLIVEAPAGSHVDLGDVVLRAPVQVEILFPPDVGDVLLHGGTLDPSPPHATAANFARSVAGGKAMLRLFPGRYGYVASNGHDCAFVELDTDALPQQPIHVVLRPAPQLCLDNRVGTGCTRVTIRSASGIAVFDTEMTGRWEQNIRVPAGTYTAILAGTRSTTTKQLEVGAGGATLTIE